MPKSSPSTSTADSAPGSPSLRTGCGCSSAVLEPPARTGTSLLGGGATDGWGPPPAVGCGPALKVGPMAGPGAVPLDGVGWAGAEVGA